MSAHGKHRVISWWRRGEIHVVRGRNHAVLDVCKRKWRLEEKFPVTGAVPPGASTERRLDTFFGRGEAMPNSAGSVTWIDGGVIQPRSYTPRPYFGLHAFDQGASITVDGERHVLPDEGAPEPRRPYGHVAVREGDRVIIFGGQGEHGPIAGGAILHLPTTNSPARWEPIPDAGIEGRQSHLASALVGERFFAWGETFARTLDLTTMTWSDMSMENAPVFEDGGWSNLAVVKHGGKLVVLPISGPGGAGRLKSGALYDPAANRWTPLKGVGGRMAWALDDDRVLMASTRGAFAGVIVDLKRARTRKLSPPNANREKLAVHFSGERLFVIGGISKKMTNRGGGCENHVGPRGCDPVPPSYRVKQHLDGWVLRP